MVGTAHDAMLACGLEVALEARVDDVAALGGFDEDELQGLFVDEGTVAHQLPVDVALVVTDVDAVDAEAHGWLWRRSRCLRCQDPSQQQPAGDNDDKGPNPCGPIIDILTKQHKP